MASNGTAACERCGRIVTANEGCPQHRGSRLLDLQRAEDRAWREDVLQVRRRRRIRLGMTVSAAVVILATVFSLTILISPGPVEQLRGEVGVADTLRRVLSFFSGGLVVGGVAWGGFGTVHAARRIHGASDTIERQAASRELAKRITAVATSLMFAISIFVLRDRLIGVPAELAAAAAALVLTPPVQSLLDFVVHRRFRVPSKVDEPATLLPPAAEHAPPDTREVDPLQRLRTGSFRKTIMDRR